jgi:transposase-like protein
MSIKFQYKGYSVECDTPDEAKALINEDRKTAATAQQSNRAKPAQATVGQDRYRTFINDLSEHPKKVVTSIGSSPKMSLNELAKAVGAANNQILSAWMTTAMMEAKRRDIQPQQLWGKSGPRGSVTITPTPALRAAVESSRENKISAVKQTA